MQLTADIHEPEAVTKILSSLLQVTVASLVGTGFCDYLWGTPDDTLYTIERKNVSDLRSRVEDCERQLAAAVEAGARTILLIEGMLVPTPRGTLYLSGRYKSNGIRPYRYYISFFWRVINSGIPIIFTANHRGTALTIAEIVKQTYNGDSTILFQAQRTRKFYHPNSQVQALVNLGLGAAKAEAIIARYGTISAALAAPATELLAIDGIGRKTVDQFYSLVGRTND